MHEVYAIMESLKIRMLLELGYFFQARYTQRNVHVHFLTYFIYYMYMWVIAAYIVV